MNKIAIVTCSMTVLMCAFPAASQSRTSAQTPDSASTRAGFTVLVDELPVDLRLMSFFVLPGDTVRFETNRDSTGYSISVQAVEGTPGQVEDGSWRWTAPQVTGVYGLTVSCPERNDTIRINMFVLMPMTRVKNGYLNGYHIGTYPSKPYKDLAVYKPPAGFVEVTPENSGMMLTPHFRLGQFLCKQPSGYPKYVVLREELLLKLELIVEKANQQGYRCSTLTVMSGYRTPWYNRSLGNVKYSRHQWGGAADIFIDEHPADGQMDDLNRDGRINWKDAAVLYDIVDDMYGEKFYDPFVGGLGRYRRTANHGPFVHVDVRGFRARWDD